MSNEANKMKFDPIPVLPPGIAPPSAETKPSATGPQPKPQTHTPKPPEKAAESKPASASTSSSTSSSSSSTTPATSNPNVITPDWLSNIFTPSKNMGVVAVAACSLLVGWYGVRTLFPPAKTDPADASQTFVALTPSTEASKEPVKKPEIKIDLPQTPEKMAGTGTDATSPFSIPKAELNTPVIPKVDLNTTAGSATTPTTIIPDVVIPELKTNGTYHKDQNNSGVVPVVHEEPAKPAVVPGATTPAAIAPINIPPIEIPGATAPVVNTNKAVEIVPVSGASGGPPAAVTVPTLPGITVPNKTPDNKESTVQPLPKMEIPSAVGAGTPTGNNQVELPKIDAPKIPDLAVPSVPTITGTTPAATPTPVVPPPAAAPGGTSLITPNLTPQTAATPPVTAIPKPEVSLPKIENPMIPAVSVPSTPPAVTTTPAPAPSSYLTTPTAPTAYPTTRNDPKLLPVNNSATSSEVKTDFDVDLHYTKANETYESISKLHYGDARYAGVLYDFNKSTNRGNNTNVVQIPPTWWVKKQLGTPVSNRGTASTPSSVSVPDDKWTPATATNSNTYRFYTVPAGGLTFKQIARQAFGTEDDWQRIFDLNDRYPLDGIIPANTRIKLPGDSKIGQ